VASRGADQLRKFYAELVTAGSGAARSRLRSAFELVPRERFLGPGPWKVFAGNGYVETPSNDLAFVYQDIVIAISPLKRLNNGLPSLHARCLAALAPRNGENALHIGAGTGYYSAILAELVGARGSVHAMEIDEDLARAAKQNLKARTNVFVCRRSGAKSPLPLSDIIYVNAGSTAPLRVWLDALRPRGRLVFPLTPGSGRGAMLRVTRRPGGLAADFVCDAFFIPCVGAQVAIEKRRLTRAYAEGGMRDVRQLCLDCPPDDTCWMRGSGWWLSTRQVQPAV
jgi:protein-L-isoaspartate(D-aspartate) O-methyltransferase